MPFTQSTLEIVRPLVLKRITCYLNFNCLLFGLRNTYPTPPALINTQDFDFYADLVFGVPILLTCSPLD